MWSMKESLVHKFSILGKNCEKYAFQAKYLYVNQYKTYKVCYHLIDNLI